MIRNIKTVFLILPLLVGVAFLLTTWPTEVSAEPRSEEKTTLIDTACSDKGYGDGVYYAMSNGGNIDANVACIMGYEAANGITGGFIDDGVTCTTFTAWPDQARAACNYGGTLKVEEVDGGYVVTSGGSTITVGATTGVCTDYSGILTFPNWYRGVYQNITLPGGGNNCILFPNSNINALWVVVSNIVEIIIQAVGYAAVGFTIFGGFKYLTSQGESAAIQAAKQTITRAIVGLVISIVSVLILNLIVGIFGLRVDSNLQISRLTPTTQSEVRNV